MWKSPSYTRVGEIGQFLPTVERFLPQRYLASQIPPVFSVIRDSFFYGPEMIHRSGLEIDGSKNHLFFNMPFLSGLKSPSDWCNSSNGLNTILLIVKSAHFNHERRNFVREMISLEQKFLTHFTVEIYFLFGRSAADPSNAELGYEIETFNDILIGIFRQKNSENLHWNFRRLWGHLPQSAAENVGNVSLD